jgi:hypothetical protein
VITADAGNEDEGEPREGPSTACSRVRAKKRGAGRCKRRTVNPGVYEQSPTGRIATVTLPPLPARRRSGRSRTDAIKKGSPQGRPSGAGVRAQLLASSDVSGGELG